GVAFESGAAALSPRRDTTRNALFDVMLVLQNTPSQAAELPGLEAEGQELPMATATFDLTIEFQELDDGVLHGMVTYNTNLFDAATIERMAEHLAQVLEAVAADPSLPLGRIDILTGQERHQV